MYIELEQNESKGAAYLPKGGSRLAEMTYSIAGSELIIIDHTIVDGSLKGQGIGKNCFCLLLSKLEKKVSKFYLSALSPSLYLIKWIVLKVF